MAKKKDPKVDLITKVVKELESPDKYPVWVLLVESKKLVANLKMVILHIYNGDVLEYQASITASIGKEEEKWNKMKIGEQENCVITFSGREKQILEKLKDFVCRSFAEGKLQDFVPFK